jgi:hypothetical protein
MSWPTVVGVCVWLWVNRTGRLEFFKFGPKSGESEWLLFNGISVFSSSYIIAGTSYILMMIRCTRSHLAPAYKYFQRRALWREQQQRCVHSFFSPPRYLLFFVFVYKMTNLHTYNFFISAHNFTRLDQVHKQPYVLFSLNLRVNVYMHLVRYLRYKRGRW